LTPFSGQRALIEDVATQRCAYNPLFGKPIVSTIDKFRGQSDCMLKLFELVLFGWELMHFCDTLDVLVSLVRTKSLGTLRDLRLLLGAIARARLGCYLFARIELLRGSAELSPLMDKLLQWPTVLSLEPRETFTDKLTRKNNAMSETSRRISDVVEMGTFVHECAIARMNE
jgi:intron-binding protein aquarius